MAAKRVSRVHKDRLWDNSGREWLGQLGSWATAEDVTLLMAAHVSVVVHGLGRQFRTLAAEEAGRFWAHAVRHFEVPGQSSGVADDSGLTYGAQTWSRGEERLLGFVEFC